MSIFRKSDYSRENTPQRKTIGYTKKRGTRLPTQTKSTVYEKKFLILCPTGCTQDRTRENRLRQKKTFDTRTNTCRNCGFAKAPAGAKFHGLGLKKASELFQERQ